MTPSEASANTPASGASATAEALSEPSWKILIVDDTAMFRELGSLFLARSGRVFTASGAAEGLAMAKAERPDVVGLFGLRFYWVF